MKILKSDSCMNSFNVPKNSDQENDFLKAAVIQVSEQTGIDKRFILAITMQESNGCVHVHSTISPDGQVRNPGLMQDHDGDHTCNLQREKDTNRGKAIKTSFGSYFWNADQMLANCPEEMITGMVNDGVQGTAAGDGLRQTLRAAMAVNGPVIKRRQSSDLAPTIPIPAELSACNPVAVAEFSNTVWQHAVQYMQMAYATNLAASQSPSATKISTSTNNLEVVSVATSVATSYTSPSPSALSAAPTTFATSVVANNDDAAASSSILAKASAARSAMASLPNSEAELTSLPDSLAALAPTAPYTPAASVPPSDYDTTTTAPTSMPAYTVMILPTPPAATGAAVAGSSSGSTGPGEFAKANAQAYYRAARIYNSGQLPNPGSLEDAASSTRCYVSDVANRLLGWNGLPASG